MVPKSANQDQLPSSRPQFGLSALMWSILVVGIVLAYLRYLEDPRVFLLGIIFVTVAAAFGIVVGWFTHHIADATYWSVIITTAAYLSVATDARRDSLFAAAWCSVGMMAGAFCGVIQPNRPLRRIAAGVLGAIPPMPLFATFPAGPERLFDLLLAPVIGALIAVLIELIVWLEQKSQMPRYITASWFLCAVVVGNWLVPLAVR